MLAWQHSWFSPYLQGGEARLRLLLLSPDIVSSLKLQAEIIRALMNTEKPGNCIPQQQSWYLPSTLPPLYYEEDSEGSGSDIISASQLLDTCPAPARLPARPAAGLLPAAHPQQKCHTWQRSLTWRSWAASHALPACWGRSRAAWLLWKAFSQLSLLPPCRHPPCASCALGVEWERPMLHVCVWPYLCHKHQCRAHTSSPSVLLFLSLSHILRLQHLLIKVSL